MKKCILFFAAIWIHSASVHVMMEESREGDRGAAWWPSLKLTGRFSGISNWMDDYSVVVAGFNEKVNTLL